jgi:spore germination protein GerM
MNKKIIYSLVVLALIFFITSLFIFIKSGKDGGEQQPQSLQVKPGEKIEKLSMVTKVTAFFFTESSRFMRPVEYEIETPGARETAYRDFIRSLIAGKEDYIAPVPEGVTLRSLYFIERQQMLVVDFSDELIHRFPGGTSAELEFIYFIVNNICYNFKEVKKVKFLVAGNEYPTISGHLDIENPFFPDFRHLYLKDQ